jgi:hypothetical protein
MFDSMQPLKLQNLYSFETIEDVRTATHQQGRACFGAMYLMKEGKVL